MATELFINKSWTFKWKVPKKTPFGVELRYEPSSAGAKDRNAFETLEEAQRYASTRGLSDPIYHIYDKKVDFDNASLKLKNIRSQEIKATVNDDPAKGSYSAKSNIVAAASITVRDTSARNDLDIAGFKNVTILRGNTSGGYTVRGGSNTVVHTYSATDTTGKQIYKDSASISGKADGILLVSGAHVSKAEGAWASAGSTSGGIAYWSSAFIPKEPGSPVEDAWGGNLRESPLATGLPGYFSVSLVSGASADVLIGGGLTYWHVYDKTYTNTHARNKSGTYLAYATGMLTVSNATVGSAFRYTNALVSNGDFTLLVGGNVSQGGQAIYSAGNTTSYKTTSSSINSSGTAGSLILVDHAKKGNHRCDVLGYATVTVANAKLDSANAAIVKKYSAEKEEFSNTNDREKYKAAFSSADFESYSQGGVLNNPKKAGEVSFGGNVVGFGTVTLSGATFSGGLLAACYDDPTSQYPVRKYYAPGNYSRTESRVSSSRDATTGNSILVQSKLSEKFTYTAAGGVTLNAAKVGKGIFGYNTVKLTGVSVGGGISAGARVYDYYDSMNFTAKTGMTSTLSSGRDTHTALGTLNMTGGTLSGGDIRDFSTVTFDGVQGNVKDMMALNISGAGRSSTSSGGGVTLLDDHNASTFVSGLGALTVNNGGNLKIDRIYGYTKITMSGGTVANGIDSGWMFRSGFTSKSTSDTKAGTSKNIFNSSSISNFAGSVQLRNAAVAASGIHGYKTVTLERATVSGGIGREATVRGGIYAPTFVSQATSADYDNGARPIKKWGLKVSSAAAEMELTLKDGAVVCGDVRGAKKLTASGASIDAPVRIDGMVDMTIQRDLWNSSFVYDVKKDQTTITNLVSSLNSAAGTFTGNFAAVGDVAGAAKVLGAWVSGGDVDACTTSDYSRIVQVFSGYNGSISSWAGSFTYLSSATGAATLSWANLGAFRGFSNASLALCSIGNADGTTEKSTSSSLTTKDLFQSNFTSTVEGGKSFAADYLHASGGIMGYKAISLNGGAVDGGIYSVQRKVSEVAKTMRVGASGASAQVRTYETSTAPEVTLTLKNKADVSCGAAGIKTATITDGARISGTLTMSGRVEKATNYLTSNNKTGSFEQSWNYSSGAVVGGALTLKSAKIKKIGTEAGDVFGAGTVTMTDASVNGGVNGGSRYCTSSIIAKGTQIQSDGPIVNGGMVYVDSNYATEWNEKDSSVASAAGAFTMTGGGVGGAISGFATVKLTGAQKEYATVGRAAAGVVTSLTSHSYKNGVDTYSQSIISGVLGTLTAACVTFTDTDVLAEGFATVTLTDCNGAGGAIWGGTTEETRNGTGNGTNFAAARTAAVSSSPIETCMASGTVTATRTDLKRGGIINCAAVNLTDCTAGSIEVYGNYTGKTALTLAGSNTVGAVSGIASVTVKSGDAEAIGYTGTEGSDTFTVNAGTAITLTGDWDFLGGDDKAVINGTVRLFGALGNSDTLALSGSGVIAVTNGNYADAYAALNASGVTKGSVELVNAGDTEGTLRAIRTKKEELADNTFKTAVKFTGNELNGWISDDEDRDNGKFADTTDWIKFTYDANCDYAVGLEVDDRRKDIQVEIWKNGEFVKITEWKNGAFDVYSDKFVDGAEYQVMVAMAPSAPGYDKSALAYTFTASPKA